MNNNYCTYYIKNDNSKCTYQEINNSKNIEVIYRYLISMITKKNTDNKTQNSFIQQLKELYKELKVLLNPNIMNYCQM